jgi:hypothetical protein
MTRILTEKNLVVILFLMVVITFSFAQKESKKIEHLYKTVAVSASSPAIAIYKAEQTLMSAGAVAIPD